MKKVILVLTALAALAASAVALAAASGVAVIADNVTSNLASIAKLITAGSYVAGIALVVGAIVKFKAHKDNPTQIPIGTPIALLFVGVALIFAPSVFLSGGKTLFGQSGTSALASGVSDFGAKKAQGAN
jgi:intracellular multiplication protein IcmD